jgi:energy-coupling factor transport system permease protein
MQTPDFLRRRYNPLDHYVTFTAVFAAFAFKLEWRTAVLALLCVATAFSPERRRIYRGFLKFILPLILIGFVINGIFFTGRTVLAIGPLKFKDQGLLFASGVAVRLTLIVVAVSYYFSRVSSETVSEYLIERGADRRLVYIYLLSVAMVHLMRDKLQKIYTAQSARGLDTTRNVFVRARYLFPMLVPLSYSYLAESLDRGVALRAANFSDRKRSNSPKPVPVVQMETNRAGLLAGRILFLSAIAAWIVGLMI